MGFPQTRRILIHSFLPKAESDYNTPGRTQATGMGESKKFEEKPTIVELLSSAPTAQSFLVFP